MVQIHIYPKNYFILFLILIFFLTFSLTTLLTPAHGQFLPLPPPLQNNPSKLPPNFDEFQVSNDKDPPIINMITSELKEGKNLIFIEIIDDSPLKSRQLKYAYQGQIKVINLVKDKENVYKGLIYGTPPKNVLEISAKDYNENMAVLQIEIKVIESKNILQLIFSWFKEIFF